MPTQLDEAMRLAIYWMSEHSKVQKLARELRDENASLKSKINTGQYVIDSADKKYGYVSEELTRLRDRIIVLEDVIRFYADDGNWAGAPAAIVDNGQKARECLI